MLNDNSNCKL